MSRRTLTFSGCLFFSIALNHQANGIVFDFLGGDSGGTGSATLDVSIAGSTLTSVLDNTSPITLDGGGGENAPGITGFGFDLDNSPTLLS